VSIWRLHHLLIFSAKFGTGTGDALRNSLKLLALRLVAERATIENPESTCRVIPVDRIIPDIGIEVALILISDGIDLEEASFRRHCPHKT